MFKLYPQILTEGVVRMNDLLIGLIKSLPFTIQPIFILLLFMPSFVTKTVMPITSFFSKKIFNRAQNRLSEIISNKDLDKDLISESEKELSVISKMSLTESRDRRLALYFYELSNISKHIIPYNQFKKLYKCLSFDHEDIFINKDKMKRSSICNWISIVSCIVLSVGYFYLCLQESKASDISYYYYVLWAFLSASFEFLAFLFYDLKIKEAEILYFINIKNLYHKKVIDKLSAQFGDDFLLTDN